MALSLQPNQNNRGVLSVRPLSTMKEDQFSPPMLAERLLASRAAALVAAGLPDIYQRALFHWPTDPMNNNHIVTSSSGDLEHKKTKKRRTTTKRDTDAPLSPPSSGSSPPVGEAPRDKVFTCKVCSRSFGYKHVLQNHERTHTGEKPFECGECHKRFTRDHHLKTHLRLHTGEKPYSCPHCPRHFVQVANLRRHLRVHTGEKPYACARCQARFSDSNQLKAHALIHDGEKPFCCSKCGARFRRRHHLLHHRCGMDCETSPPRVAPLPHGHRRDSGCEPDGGSPAPPGLPSPAPSSLRDLSEDFYGEEDDALSGCGRMLMDEPLDCSMPEQTEPEDLSLPRRQRARTPPPAHSLIPAHLHRRRKYHLQC